MSSFRGEISTDLVQKTYFLSKLVFFLTFLLGSKGRGAPRYSVVVLVRYVHVAIDYPKESGKIDLTLF